MTGEQTATSAALNWRERAQHLRVEADRYAGLGAELHDSSEAMDAAGDLLLRDYQAGLARLYGLLADHAADWAQQAQAYADDREPVRSPTALVPPAIVGAALVAYSALLVAVLRARYAKVRRTAVKRAYALGRADEAADRTAGRAHVRLLRQRDAR